MHGAGGCYYAAAVQEVGISFMREKLPAIGRALSLVLLVATIAVVVTAFIRARKQPRPPGPLRAEPVLKGNVTSIIEGYKYVKTDNGRETLRLLAAKDTAYSDGRHELEQVDLTSFDEQPGKSTRIIADRASYLQQPGQVTFDGNVKVTNTDGLEVTTQTLKYDQQTQLASTEVAIQFRQGEVSGTSIGAQLYAKEHNLQLLKDAYVISTSLDPKKDPQAKPKPGPPLELRGEKASYIEKDGVLRFEGNASAVQGDKSAKADAMTGFVNVQTRKLERVELRGNAHLQSQEKGKASELLAQDMDFLLDENQQLKTAVGNITAIARSLEKDAPRELRADRIQADYLPTEKGTVLQTMTTQGRTVMKIEVAEGAPNTSQAKDVSERVLEADAVQANYHADGKHLARAEANGNAVLTITPKQITPTAERKRLRAAKFNAEFYETGNVIKTFLADGNPVAEFEPLQPETKGKDGKLVKRPKKTMSGKKMTANLSQQTQDVVDLIVDGDAKFTDGDRTATALRAVYTGETQLVTLRGKPLLWDSSARANADEIDVNVGTDESFLRGKVRTTYFSRETTGGAAPFKKEKAPVTIASDRAQVKHREGAARYQGNVRAWQDNDFVRADNLELDKGERLMTAWGNAQSAFYDFEREVEKGKKEVVPVFATAERIVYSDETRTAHYEGAVKVRQGTDVIDAAVADAVMDQEHKLVQMTASNNVVVTQPNRRATGDQVVYTAANDTAILTGNLAMVEDREREAVTKSAKLTLHLRDARIEANDDSGNKKRVKTTHRIQK